MPKHIPALLSLGERSHQDFLDVYWQKKPLLVRQAIKAFRSPLDNTELAGLACEAEIESRLVIRDPSEPDPAKQWTVQHGPFTEENFLALPEQNWTLLVQDVDKWLPQAAELLQEFRFIPDWRVDDLMISYATDGGSVGAHWDDYDVFLLQGSGQRRWMIDEREADPDNVLEGPAVRLLRDFTATQEWLLEPGDMLYLPPRIAHHGIAVGENCQTLSVGFRAPSHFELLEDFSQHVLEQVCADHRYRDTHLEANQHPAEISPQSAEGFREIITQLANFSEETFQTWLGEYLTRPKAGIAPLPPEETLSDRELADVLSEHSLWQRDAASRFAFSRQQPDKIDLFINGQGYDFSSRHTAFIETLCREHALPSQVLGEACLQHLELKTLVLELINQGHLYPLDEDQAL